MTPIVDKVKQASYIIRGDIESLDDYSRLYLQRKVYYHALKEMDELLCELSSNESGEDGIYGEAIDVILCMLDIININTKNTATEKGINHYMIKKIKKWVDKSLNGEYEDLVFSTYNDDGTERSSHKKSILKNIKEI